MRVEMVGNASDVASAWIDFVLKTNPRSGSISVEEYVKLSDGSDWAVDALNDLIYDNINESLDVMYEIAKTHDSWILENLGSGPFETLFSVYGDNALAALKGRDLTLGVRRALSSVWSESFSDEIQSFLRSVLQS
jgi:hypothetical protein